MQFESNIYKYNYDWFKRKSYNLMQLYSRIDTRNIQGTEDC